MMSKNKFLHKLQERWGVNSLSQVIIILIVFALTGTTILFIKRPLLDFIGFNQINMVGWLKQTLSLILVLIFYQGILLIYGFIFGQFQFFWNKEKKLFFLIKRLFVKKKTNK